jgi:hypothetical protein
MCGRKVQLFRLCNHPSPSLQLLNPLRRSMTWSALRPEKEIARDLKVSRNTVRKVLRSGETSFEYERIVQPRPKLGVLPVRYAAARRARRVEASHVREPVHTPMQRYRRF